MSSKGNSGAPKTGAPAAGGQAMLFDVLRVSDRHIVLGDSMMAIKISTDPGNGVLLLNECEVNRAIRSFAAAYGVRVPSVQQFHPREDGSAVLMSERLPGRPFMGSVQVEVDFPGIPLGVYRRLAQLVIALDEIDEESSPEGMRPSSFSFRWTDEDLDQRYKYNVLTAARRSLISWADAARLYVRFRRGFARRLQHHDLGPWNVFETPNSEEIGLIDAEFGGWRHRLYDAVYLLLQWTVNKPYRQGVEQWIEALEEVLSTHSSLRTFTDLLRVGRHAIAYRLVATTGELAGASAARARFARAAELLLAEDFDGLARFFRYEAFVLE